MITTTEVPAKNSFGKTRMVNVSVHHYFKWNGLMFLVTETLPGSDIVGRENVKYGVTEPQTGMLLGCYSDDPEQCEKYAIELLESKGLEKVTAAIERGKETVRLALEDALVAPPMTTPSESE